MAKQKISPTNLEAWLRARVKELSATCDRQRQRSLEYEADRRALAARVADLEAAHERAQNLLDDNMQLVAQREYILSAIGNLAAAVRLAPKARTEVR